MLFLLLIGILAQRYPPVISVTISPFPTSSSTQIPTREPVNTEKQQISQSPQRQSSNSSSDLLALLSIGIAFAIILIAFVIFVLQSKKSSPEQPPNTTENLAVNANTNDSQHSVHYVEYNDPPPARYLEYNEPPPARYLEYNEPPPARYLEYNEPPPAHSVEYTEPPNEIFYTITRGHLDFPQAPKSAPIYALADRNPKSMADHSYSAALTAIDFNQFAQINCFEYHDHDDFKKEVVRTRSTITMKPLK